MAAKEYVKEFIEEYNRMFCRNTNGRLREDEIEKFLEMREAIKRIGKNPNKLVKNEYN